MNFLSRILILFFFSSRFLSHSDFFSTMSQSNLIVALIELNIGTQPMVLSFRSLNSVWAFHSQCVLRLQYRYLCFFYWIKVQNSYAGMYIKFISLECRFFFNSSEFQIGTQHLKLCQKVSAGTIFLKKCTDQV